MPFIKAQKAKMFYSKKLEFISFDKMQQLMDTFIS